MRIVFFGLSITSSRDNRHATTYRGLVRELVRNGHSVTFFERDLPCFALHRDVPERPWCATVLYGSLAEIEREHADAVRDADLVILGSRVEQGALLASWLRETTHGVLAFYDLDAPETIAALERGECTYLGPDQPPLFDAYLSFTGGPLLRRLERELGARRALPLYCSFDPDLYYPEPVEARWDFGYLGSWSLDREPAFRELLLEPARRWPEGRFAVAGASYPASAEWPANVDRSDHLPAARHRAYFCAQRFTLNLTHEEMVRSGYSASTRLFEAAACGTPVLTDAWLGIELFFCPGHDLLVVDGPEAIERVLRQTTENERRRLARNARRRAISEHTAAHRAARLEIYTRALQERIGTRRLRTNPAIRPTATDLALA